MNFCNAKKQTLQSYVMRKHIAFCTAKIWRLQTSVVSMEKEETLNFCTAKKRTLQSFVVKKADSANFCSAKKRTLQISRGTLQNWTCNIYYKCRVIARAFGCLFKVTRARAITLGSRPRVRTLIQSHTRHIL